MTDHQDDLYENRLPDDQARVLDALLAARAANAAEPDPTNDATDDRVKPDDRTEMSPEDFEIAQRVSQVLSLLEHDPVEEPPADLVARTLDRVETAERRRRLVFQGDSLARDGEECERGRLPWRNIFAVAAMLIVGVAMLYPAMMRMREAGTRAADLSNLSAAGQAMGLYASDNNDYLPRRSMSFEPGERVWWNVGDPAESNSAHLYHLAREGYINPDVLNSPTNPFAPRGGMTREMFDWRSPQEVSYSYQNQFRPEGMRITQSPRMAVLANKNPLFAPRPDRGMHFRTDVPLDASSASYDGQGQNVLFSDGSALWTELPVIGDDNIWTAGEIDRYTGRELPESPRDSFLVP